MYHFFIDASQKKGREIIVTGSDVNHMKNVLRMKPGGRVCVNVESAWEYECEISRFDKGEAHLTVVKERIANRELPADLILYQGLPKGDKMELIIQKAVELGASKIVPVATKRSVVKLDEKKEQAKRRRWQSICESAAKQSGRTKIPEVGALMGFEEAIKEAVSFDAAYIPYECERDMNKTLAALEQVEKGMRIGIFIGPEGGFEAAEIELAKKAGIVPITLGRRILRTETAGLMLLSVLMFRLESSLAGETAEEVEQNCALYPKDEAKKEKE